MKNYTIRPIKTGDEAQVLEMVKSLLLHLGDGIEHFDDDRFLKDVFGEDPQCSLFVAATPVEKLLAYILFHDSYEPGHAARGVYVVDFYVEAQVRGKGIGTALLQAVARDAHARGRDFIWLVTTHDEARAYYDRKMDVKVEVTAYALTGERFEALIG